MKTIRLLFAFLLTVSALVLTAQAHPGHGDGFLRAESPAHLLLHPTQLLVLLIAAAGTAALARATWMRWTGTAIAVGSAALMVAGLL